MGEDQKPVETAKPGYKATEFWLSLVAVIAGFVLASGVGAPTEEGGKPGTAQTVAGCIVTVLGALGYTHSRTSVKVAEEMKRREEAKGASFVAWAAEKVKEAIEARRKAEIEAAAVNPPEAPPKPDSGSEG